MNECVYLCLCALGVGQRVVGEMGLGDYVESGQVCVILAWTIKGLPYLVSLPQVLCHFQLSVILSEEFRKCIFAHVIPGPIQCLSLACRRKETIFKSGFKIRLS